ncbi:MAG: dihydrofolate reductase family protein [Microbacteriaceae bacterium]
MGTLIVTMMTTLDGVAQAPGGQDEDTRGGFQLGGWTFPYVDEDGGKTLIGWFSTAEAFLLGHHTYDIFAAYWPNAEPGDPVADALNTLPKHVAVGAEQDLGWSNVIAEVGDLAEIVARLKRQYDGEIQVHGSIELVHALHNLDLIDEYRIWTFPLVVGSGARLFPGGTTPRAFELVTTTSTASGVIASVYRPAGEVRTGTLGARS